METELINETQAEKPERGNGSRVIDADVHHQYPSGAAIAEYLPPGPVTHYYSGGGSIPHPDGAFRLDTSPPDGGIPGSSPQFVVKDHLDRHEIDFAILSCGNVFGLSCMHDLDAATALARATNDWTVEEWFSVDDRFLGSITIAAGDPDEAAKEIRRLGSNPRMVQVCATTSLPCSMGDPFLDPIYAACAETGLPFTLHQGGLGTADLDPATFPELHVDMCFPVLPHIVSLIYEGVPERYPDLKFVFNEFGITWLPFLLWRMDMEYRSAGDEVPWLTKLPSEYMKEHLRFTTQPLEEPKRRGDLIKLLESFDGQEMLMFSSDYPHWDADNPRYALRGFPPEWKEQIFFENARKTFKLDGLAKSAVGPRG